MTAPLRLHGYPVSNYFNVARAALIEKAVPHEIVLARASQNEAFLARSPMGKIPVLKTPDGWIAETVAIIEYLDDVVAEPQLRPRDAYQRARMRQIVNILQVYVEVPARSLFPGVFVDGPVAPEIVDAAQTMLVRSAGALARLMRPAPLLFGENVTAADLFAFYILDIAERVTRFRFGWSVMEAIGGLNRWDAAMRERPGTRAVLGDFAIAFDRYLVDRLAPYREPADTPPSGSPAHA